jgi:type IV secretion system protein VirB6
MGAASGFFADFFAKLDLALASYQAVVVGRMYIAITPASKLMFTLLIVMFGFRLLFGKVQEPLRDGVLRVVRGAVILSLLQVGNYNAFIADFFMNAPDQLAAAVTGQAPGDRIHFLDSLWEQQYTFAEAFWLKGTATSIAGIGLVLLALLLFAVALLTTGAAAAMLLVAKAGLYVWLSVGPVFVLMVMFDATKQFTNSWLGQCVTFALLPMLVSAVIYLILSLAKAYLTGVAGVGGMADPAINQALKYIFVAGAAGLFLKQIPSFASGLGGGVAISTLGAVGAAMNAATGGLGSAKDLLSGKTLSDMRGARHAKARNAEWAKDHPGRTARLTLAAYRKMTRPGKNTVSKS